MAIRDARSSWLARAVQRARGDIWGLLSLLLFYAGTALIFRSGEFALIVTASLGFHEIGHALALTCYGLNWRIVFGLVGAWTWSSNEDRERLSQISNAWIHVAGPVFSLVLALLAVGLNVVWQPQSSHLLILANFSAQVGFLNLLPLGPVSDGGKAVRRMILSLDGRNRRRAVILPVLTSGLLLSLYGLAEVPLGRFADPGPFLLGLLLVACWMASSLLIETVRAGNAQMPGENPQRPDSSPVLLPVTGWQPGRPITSRQAVLLLLVIWVVLIVDLVVISATPFWLAPQYVKGGLQNAEAIVFWIGRLVGSML